MNITEIINPKKFLELMTAINISIKESGIIADSNKLLGVLSSIEYYDDPKDKVSCLIRSMIKNHSFFSGNKRTAALFYIAMCYHMGVDINLSTNEFIDLFKDIARNNYTVEQISSILFPRDKS